MAKSKKVNLSKPVQSEKVPAVPRVNALDKNITFHFGKLDEKRWPLHDISKEHLKRLLKKLKYIEQLSVTTARQNEVISDYSVEDIPNKTARKAITDLELDSICKINIAHSESLRLFGIREINQIYILWWDPVHEIWPEGKTVR